VSLPCTISTRGGGAKQPKQTFNVIARHEATRFPKKRLLFSWSRLLRSVQKVQECDATMFDRYNTAWLKKKITAHVYAAENIKRFFTGGYLLLAGNRLVSVP
jgi:hypothetical protein